MHCLTSTNPVFVNFRHFYNTLDDMNASVSLLIVLVICWFHVSTYAQYNAADRGLTEVPNDIPCHVRSISLQRNRILRIEADSFPCHAHVIHINIARNDLIYIDRDAFQFCGSLQVLMMGLNARLQQLPPSFGPNTANMLRLYIQFLNLQSLPDAYFKQFESLEELAITDWGLTGALNNDVLNGLSRLRLLGNGCCSSIPNMTGHLPRLEDLFFDGLPEDRIPEENIYGLHMLRVTIRTPCSYRYIPVFEGAVRLESVDASQCEVTELPDVSQHRALKEFKANTAQFQCNPKCCWMLYENITAEGLAWIPSITCNGPPNLAGHQIANISTLQARCFESELIWWIWHVRIKMMHTNYYPNPILCWSVWLIKTDL